MTDESTQAANELDEDEIVTIRIIDLPVPLYHKLETTYRELAREMLLIRAGDDPDAPPSRLRAVIEEMQVRYRGFTLEPPAKLRAAIEEGRPSVTLRYDLPRGQAAQTARVLALLQELDVYRRTGGLLTVAPSASEVAVRDWYLGEFIRQARGEPPMPWGEVQVPDEPGREG